MDKPYGIGECYDHVTIDKDGQVKLEQHGYAHGACQQASKHLEQSLGIVKDRKSKDDPGGGSYQAVG